MGTRIVITLSTCLAIAAFACSSPDVVSTPTGQREPAPSPDKTKAPTNTGDKNTPSNPDEQAPPAGGDPAPAGGDGAACVNEANAEGCFTCCDKIDPKAFDAAMQASDACLCGATGACKTQCANSVCKGQDPDQACETCLGSQAAQKCEDAFYSTCEKSASCKTVMACEDKCADKFPQQGGGGD